MRLNGLPEHDHGGSGVGGPFLRPNRLQAPLVESVNKVEDPEVGEMVYVVPSGNSPEGRWRYTGSGWRSGGANPRNTFNAFQQQVQAGDNIDIVRFTLPDPPAADFGTRLAVWQLLATRITGPASGVFARVEVGGETLIEDEADTANVAQDQPGAPLAFDGASGDEVRVRLRNTQGQDRTVTAFSTVSIEYQTEEP